MTQNTPGSENKGSTPTSETCLIIRGGNIVWKNLE